MGELDLDDGLLVGSEIRSVLKLNVGDYLAVHSARSFHRIREAQEEGSELVLLPDDYEVRGIVDAGYFEYNANFMLTSLENAQADLGGARAGRATEGRLTGADPAAVSENPPAGLVVRTDDENSHLLEALRVERNVMFYLLFFVMIVARSVVTSSQIACGAAHAGIGTPAPSHRRPDQVGFLVGLFVAALGLTFGFGIGLLALEFRNEFLVLMRDLTGFEIFLRAFTDSGVASVDRAGT